MSLLWFHVKTEGIVAICNFIRNVKNYDCITRHELGRTCVWGGGERDTAAGVGASAAPPRPHFIHLLSPHD